MFSKKDRKTNNDKALIPGKDQKNTGSEKVKQALRVRFALEQEPKVDMYFYRAYRKLRLVRYLCVLLAALFVMSVPMVYSDQITTENFKYLLKYIDMQLSEDSEDYTEFAYDSADNMHFGVYAEDIVVCTDTSIVFYDKLGNESMRASFGPYNNAQLLVSDKYVMVYDRGGSEYLVFNNFKMVHRGTTDQPITLCALSDSGRYLILSSNQNYTSEIMVYSANFEQMNRVQKDMYISSVFFHDETDEFGYTGFTTDEKGGKHGEICYYNMLSEKTIDILSDDIPLNASAYDDFVRVVYADKIAWYTRNGQIQTVYRFPSSAANYCNSIGKLAVCFPNDTAGEFGCLRIIGTNNEQSISVALLDIVNGIRWHDGNYYVIGQSKLQKVDAKGNTVYCDLSPQAKEILFLPNEQIMVCYPDHTEFVLFAGAVA